MPFDLRCPDCRAKLRLDEKPDRDASIECPKCGSTFTPADSAAADRAAGGSPKSKKGKKGKKAPQEAKSGAPVGDGAPKEAEERTFFNPFALLGIIVAALGVYVGVCWFVLYVLGKSGRIEDIVAFIPKDCNTVRGANLQVLNRYPGYKGELDKYETPPVKAALDELAKANGMPEDAFQDYMVYGKNRDKGGVNTTVFAFRCKDDVNPAAVKAALKATDENTKTGPALRMPGSAPGILAGALVDIPTRRHVVVVPTTGNSDQGQALALSRAATADRSKSFTDEMGDTGQVAMRGHGWIILKVRGANESVPTGLIEPLKKDFAALTDKLKATKTIGLWNSFGGSVRFGGAIDCGDSGGASTVAKALKEGPMGQGDDAEIPRGLKQAFNGANNKEFRAMMAQFSFRTSGSCAYYTSSMSGEAAKQMLQTINLPVMIDGGATGTGQ